MFSNMHSGSWKAAAFAALVLIPAVVFAGPYDPAAQFSPVSNPNGVWSYGYENVPLPNPFIPLTVPAPVPASPTFVDSWQAPAFGEVGRREAFDGGNDLGADDNGIEVEVINGAGGSRSRHWRLNQPL